MYTIKPAPKTFGSFGAYVDDVDMSQMTDADWMELGQLFLDKLVVVFRNIKMDKTQYLDWIPKWGPYKSNLRKYFKEKYGDLLDVYDTSTWETVNLDPHDRTWLEVRKYQLEESGDGRFLTRVFGGRDSEGRMLGYFSHGDVGWHSNEGSSLTHSPAVALLGWDHMKTSATSFAQTVDLFDSFSESFKSELREMVITHAYVPGLVNDTELTDPEFAHHTKTAFCPVEGAETPLVCRAPGGQEGLHYPVNTRHTILGMSEAEYTKIFDILDKAVLDPNNVWDHWYSTDNDLLIFDNTVTLHRRLGGDEERLAFRCQFDVSQLLDKPWEPWKHLPEYHQRYVEEVTDLVNLVGGNVKQRFKLPA